MVNTKIRFFVLAILVGVVLVGCSQPGDSPTPQPTLSGEKLRVLATTTIVADVVRSVAGNQVDLDVLVPPGVDEHTFQYTPADMTRVVDADVIFMNGAGLETFMGPLLNNAGEHARVVSVSDGIPLMEAAIEATHQQQGSANDVQQDGDPHVWLDPNNVVIWTKNIEAALAEADPAHAADYRANAEKYRQELAQLNLWIQQQTAQIPEVDRQLVTDHEIFTYFAARYGFKQIGAIVPSYSSVAEPSAQELAGLEDAIRQFGAKVVFVGNTVNPSLAQRVATDTGVALVPIYTGSLTKGAPAGTYLDYMRFNVAAIVKALK